MPVRKDPDKITSMLRQQLAKACPHEREKPFVPRALGELEGSSDTTPFHASGLLLLKCVRCGRIRTADGRKVDGRALVAALKSMQGDGPGLELRIGETKTAKLSPSGPVAPPAAPSGSGIEPRPESGGRYRLEQPTLTFDDVVLPEATRLEIEQAIFKLRHHELIYDAWGFGEVDPRGRSVTLNFYGPPGTGKTMTAEALAHELDLPLMRITSADIEDRFLGESAKNVQRVFEAATDAGALVFFDEADTLFGRRASDVTQGVDHEVNATKSTLLVELERFQGVVVLATNFEQNFDQAFVRRLAWHVSFRLPGLSERRQIWDRFLVSGIPLEDEREKVLDEIAFRSEGLAGGDILTAMRTALPAALRRSGLEDPVLTVEDVKSAIARIRRARRDVANQRRGSAATDAAWLFDEQPAPPSDPPEIAAEE